MSWLSARQRRAVAIIGLAAAAVAVVSLVYVRPALFPSSVRTSVATGPPTMTAPGEQVAITFLTPSLGWAAATIEPLEHTLFVFATDDGARTWRQIATISVEVYAPPGIFRFFDETHGVMAVASSFYFKTDDGGESWSRVALPADVLMAFADFKDVWATSNSGPSTPTKMYSTTDGGASWKRLPDLPVNGAVVFENASDGALVTDSHRVYTTTDGGRTWHRIGDLPRPACAQPTSSASAARSSANQCAPNGGGVYLVLLPDGGLLAGDGAYEPPPAFISLNGGLGWRQLPPLPGSADSGEVSYQDSSRWWLVDDNRLFKTADSGATWTLISSSLPFALGTPTIVDSDHAWITFGVGDAGAQGNVLLITSDGGLTWKSATVPIPH